MGRYQRISAEERGVRPNINLPLSSRHGGDLQITTKGFPGNPKRIK